MVFQKVFDNRWAHVFDNALVKMSRSLANKIIWQWVNHALLSNDLWLYFLWLDNLFQEFLAGEDRLHGNADLKTEIIHLSLKQIFFIFSRETFLTCEGCYLNVKMSSVLTHGILSQYF